MQDRLDSLVCVSGDDLGATIGRFKIELNTWIDEELSHCVENPIGSIGAYERHLRRLAQIKFERDTRLLMQERLLSQRDLTKVRLRWCKVLEAAYAERDTYDAELVPNPHPYMRNKDPMFGGNGSRQFARKHCDRLLVSEVMHIPSLLNGLLAAGLRRFQSRCLNQSGRFSGLKLSTTGIQIIPWNTLAFELPPRHMLWMLLTCREIHHSILSNNSMTEGAYCAVCLSEPFPEPGSSLFKTIGARVAKDPITHLEELIMM